MEATSRRILRIWEVEKVSMEPPDCILAVSDDGVLEIEAVLTDSEPKSEDDAIHIKCVQTKYKLIYWVKTIWGRVKSLYWNQ